jgi:hypothetical protein
MTTLTEFQRAIDARMRRGESFATIEDELIEPSRLSNEAKSALWLYGWSFVDRREQRREARAHIARIVRRADAVSAAEIRNASRWAATTRSSASAPRRTTTV